MMKHEFEELTGKKVSTESYEVWERMYVASNLTKQEFCKLVKKAVVADAWKDAARMELNEYTWAKEALDKFHAEGGSPISDKGRELADNFYCRLHNLETKALLDENRFNYFKEHGPAVGFRAFEEKTWEDLKQANASQRYDWLWYRDRDGWHNMDIVRCGKGKYGWAYVDLNGEPSEPVAL